MQKNYFDRMLDEIYGAFGKPRPSYGSPAYNSLWRRVTEELYIPDEAAKPIAYSMAERDSFPSNPGKAIMEEFFNWLGKNPKIRAFARACTDCSTDIPGWFWAWDGDGMRYVCKCACNQDDKMRHIKPWNRREAMAFGYSLKNPDVLAGPVQNEYTGVIGKPGPSSSSPRELQRMRANAREMERAESPW